MPLEDDGIELEANLETLPEIEAPVNESMEETVRRSIIEVGKSVEEKDAEDSGLQGDKGSKVAKAPAEKEESESTKAAKTLANLKNRATKGPKQVVDASQLEATPPKLAAPKGPIDRLEPPQRFPVERKEWFNKQPRELQQQITKDYSEWEGQFTKTQQEAVRIKSQLQNTASELGSSLDVIKQNAPIWAKRGITPSAALTESVQLINDINENPHSAILDLCSKANVTLEELYQIQQQGGFRQQQQKVEQPKNSYLTKEQLYEEMNNIQRQNQDRAAIDELFKLQNTVDAQGSYLYRELHDAESIERLKPLTDRVRKSQPGISWTEATKQAIVWDRQLRGISGPPSSNSVGLPPNIQKIKQATLSINQRGAPTVPTIANGKSNEKMEDTVARSIAEVRAKYNG